MSTTKIAVGSILDKLSEIQLPFNSDSFVVTAKNTFGDPLEIKYYLNGLTGTLMGTITNVYDVDGDLYSQERT
jgi:hypothetical protein